MVTVSTFGELDGQIVRQFTLDNGTLKVELITYGAAIRSIQAPDRNGSPADVTLGFDDLDGYLSKHGKNPFFGCSVGRVGNRVANAQFTLDGITVNLAKNNGPNALHGGLRGLDKVIWNAYSDEVVPNCVHFGFVDKDGANNFRGDVCVNITYTLTPNNEITIDYKALTTKPTPVNLTNHSYFNLGGHTAGKASLYGHQVTFAADHTTPVDEALIPTGEIKPVTGSGFDLTKPNTNLGEAMTKAGGGFDHNFCIRGFQENMGQMKLVCNIEEPISGRCLEVKTNQPGVQFYTANFLPEDDSLIGKENANYKKHGGFCLETQNFPDAINQKNFPNSVLRPGQLYEHNTVFRFYTN